MLKALTKRRKLLVAASGFLGVAAMTVGMSVPAGATAATAANNTLIGSGSNTAYTTMQQLSDLYNSAPGCNLLQSSGTQELDFSCASSPQTGDENGYEVFPGSTVSGLDYFSMNPYNDASFEEPAMGSSKGIGELEDNGTAGSGINAAPISYARSSRAPNATDLGLQFVAYADDAVPWFHFTKYNKKKTPSGGIANLTHEQLDNIYSCSVAYHHGTDNCANWATYGGSDAPIDCYMAQNGSGTEATWDADILNSPSNSIPDPPCLTDGNDGSNGTTSHVIFENEDSSIISGGDAADAIFYFSYGKFSLLCPKGAGDCTTGLKKSTTALGEIDGNTANSASIRCEDDPSVCPAQGAFYTDRRLYNVYENGSSNNTDSIPVASQATLNFLSTTGFLCSVTAHNAVDPVSPYAAPNNTYGYEIDQIISGQGFFPIDKGVEGDGSVTGAVTPWTSSSSSSKAQITDNTGVSNNPLNEPPYLPSSDSSLYGTNPYYLSAVNPSTSPANNGDEGFCRVFEGS